MRKGVKIIDDPKSIKTGMGDTKSKILSLLRDEDMGISEITEKLGKDRSTIYRHIRKLEHAGFVEMVNENNSNNSSEKIYGRTADIFLMSTDKVDDKVDIASVVEWDLADAKKILQRMEEIGYQNNKSDALANRLTDFFTKLSEKSKEHYENGCKDMGILDCLRLKLLMLLLEIENHPDLEKRVKKIASDFKSDG